MIIGVAILVAWALGIGFGMFIHAQISTNWKERWELASRLLAEEQLKTAQLETVQLDTVVPAHPVADLSVKNAKRLAAKRKAAKVRESYPVGYWAKVRTPSEPSWSRERMEATRLEAGLPPTDSLKGLPSWSKERMLKRRYKAGWDDEGVRFK